MLSMTLWRQQIETLPRRWPLIKGHRSTMLSFEMCPVTLWPLAALYVQQCCRPPLVLATIATVFVFVMLCEDSQSVSSYCAKCVNCKFSRMSVNSCRNLYGLHLTHRRTWAVKPVVKRAVKIINQLLVIDAWHVRYWSDHWLSVSW